MGRMIKNAKDSDERVLIDRLWKLRHQAQVIQKEHDEIRDILRRGRLGERAGFEHSMKLVSVKEHERTVFIPAHRRMVWGRGKRGAP